MKKLSLAVMLGMTILSGCSITHGNQFNYAQVDSIRRGVTTEQQIRAMFGEPVSVRSNTKRGVRTLMYRYSNDSSIQKNAAGIGGAVFAGVFASKLGVNSAIAGELGGAVAENMVTARREEQVLYVHVDLRTGVVRDYEFNEEGSRTQSWGVGKGVAPL